MASDPHEPVVCVSLPLNSKHLMDQYFVCIGKVMGPPEKVTTNHLRVIIEVKLTEMIRDAHNVQVCLNQSGRTMMLMDADNVFITAKPRMSFKTGRGAGGIGDGSTHGGTCFVGNGVGSGARDFDSDGERTKEKLAEAISHNNVLYIE